MTSLQYCVEMSNEVTGEILVRSFGSESDRQTFIQALPDHIRWVTYENYGLFDRSCLNWQLAGIR